MVLNAEAFVVFLKNFMQGRTGRIFLVIDGHPAHKAKMVQHYVESLRERLDLVPLPTYAPDLNPDEFVWSHMKKNGVSKKPLKKNESLRNRVEEDIVNLQGNRALVRSFFVLIVYAMLRTSQYYRARRHHGGGDTGCGVDPYSRHSPTKWSARCVALWNTNRAQWPRCAWEYPSE
jgi:transposase